MGATLKVTHKSIGVEVRRGTYEVVVDGQPRGSVEMNGTVEIPIDAGGHTVQVRDGRKSSRSHSFTVVDNQTIGFRCTGKRFLPIFLASFAFPNLALALTRE